MEIHNVMEELVASTVEQLANEDAESESPRYCDSRDCRTDAVCYVLNRVSPRYVSSSRGIAHITEELKRDQQLAVDLLRLAGEGLYRVSAVRRSYYGTDTGRSEATPSKPSADTAAGDQKPRFHIPSIRGRILDGARFSPISGISVELLLEGERVAMFDSRWSNPFEIPHQAPGTFLFWPAPLPAEDAGITRTFSFELRVDDPGYEYFDHSFPVTIVSGTTDTPVFNLERDHLLPDLYLFKR